MKRKLSIIQKIDVAELNNMIDEYQCTTGKTNPYLFMNKSTIDAISTVSDALYNLQRICTKLNGIADYRGYKVFRDDSLEFGEVEIR